MANEDRDYLGWLRHEPCQAPEHQCQGVIEVHHPTHLRHTGEDKRRAHDWWGNSLCTFAHGALHSLAPNGPFGGWTGEQVATFCEDAAKRNRERYEGGAPAPEFYDRVPW